MFSRLWIDLRCVAFARHSGSHFFPSVVRAEDLQAELDKLTKLKQETGQLGEWMEQRFFWADVLSELRRVLMQAEAARKQAMGVENGVWIESFTSATPGLTAAPTTGAEEEPAPTPVFYNRLMMERYGLIPRGAPLPPEGEPGATPAAPKPATPASTTRARGLRAETASRREARRRPADRPSPEPSRRQRSRSRSGVVGAGCARGTPHPPRRARQSRAGVGAGRAALARRRAQPRARRARPRRAGGRGAHDGD